MIVKLEVITPEKKIFDGEINSIKVPGSKGSFTVLKNHAPIISTLEKGIVTIITKSSKTEEIKIVSGIIEVKKNNIILLADLD
jgi:F-type H+-transporting ATPase subunit epsilon